MAFPNKKASKKGKKPARKYDTATNTFVAPKQRPMPPQMPIQSKAKDGQFPG